MPFKVRVRNFQSIEDAELVIDNLTVVTGTNNAGKSAFFRALRGALTNARGSGFVRHGKSHCTVDIEDLASGRKLTWEKGSKVNRYVVDGESLDRVGHGVPPEARIFGVESVGAGNSELWPQIAPQITGVSFLLHEPGSVIAEAVADVERVNQLSRALKACESDRRSARNDLKMRRKDGMKRLLFETSKCCGCMVCDEFCPQHVLSVAVGYRGVSPFSPDSIADSQQKDAEEIY